MNGPTFGRLCSVELVHAIHVIEGADAIDVDAAFPIDDPPFAFLEPRGVRVMEGRRVNVLRTVRLRGVYSQGIAFPLDSFPEAEVDGDLDQVLGADPRRAQRGPERPQPGPADHAQPSANLPSLA